MICCVCGKLSEEKVNETFEEVCKLFWIGGDWRRNAVRVMIKEKYTNSVLEVERVSDRIMILKMEFGGIIMNQYVYPTGGMRVGGKGRILE